MFGRLPMPSINKITQGRNSVSAVYKSGLTNLRNQTASRMSIKVMAKGVFSSFVEDLPAIVCNVFDELKK